MLTGKINGGQEGALSKQANYYKVVAVMFFGEQEVGRFPTREQAEWRARELNEWAERHPRGYVQYLVKPVVEARGEE
jgi:hypothetical protein